MAWHTSLLNTQIYASSQLCIYSQHIKLFNSLHAINIPYFLKRAY